eukprot:jgi/Tetstr1/421603/TSEL_012544.t1
MFFAKGPTGVSCRILSPLSQPAPKCTKKTADHVYAVCCASAPAHTGTAPPRLAPNFNTAQTRGHHRRRRRRLDPARNCEPLTLAGSMGGGTGERVPVIVNVYDLAPGNKYTYGCGLGIFHSGVEVYGVEYAFGGHEYNTSGIFATNPRDAPGPVQFRESIVIGETTLSQQEVQLLVHRLGETFKGNRYHLLERNCNHFTDELSMQLTNKHAPGWVNRLAALAVLVHCILPTSLVPPLIPKEPMSADAPTLGKRRNRSGGESLLQAPVVPENFGRPEEMTVRV